MSEVTADPGPAIGSGSTPAGSARGGEPPAPSEQPAGRHKPTAENQPEEPAAGPEEAGREETGREDVDPERRAAWRESLRVGFWTWLAGVAMYTLVTFVSWLPFGTAPDLNKAYEAWHRWDTTWYVIIADSGYGYDKRSAAFFPLYPLMIRGFNHVLPGDSFAAALIISVITCLVTLVLVHRLATEIMGQDIGKRTTFYLIAFPTGFYLAAAYNEGLFVALAAGAFYCMRRRRWWLAAVLMGFASATRMAGILLILAFLYEYARQAGFSPRRIRPNVLWVALAPTGLLLYAWYCWRSFGDPLFFQKMQSNWFRSDFMPPWTTIGQVVRLIGHTHPVLGPTSVRNIINLTTALAVLVLLVIALDKQWGLGKEAAYLVIFSAADILMPLSNPIQTDYPLSSMWRFALECLPVWMVLAKMGRSERFNRTYTMSALALQGVMILTFLQNQFVA